ncbi:transposase [Candidatus Neptunichlamydia sp. REUL1]|uniref:transposase n=1 Tax=Candidatus Neptunichlamydia sp. REUL1 TaxID=3064277 RepID=UPI00292E6851|nr:transposase [Candidatus Neptunochlamydia sp. REUL1]
MTYSLDFRKKALSIRSREKLSFAQTAKRFGVSVNSLFLWSKQIEPKQTKNRPAIKIDKETLMGDIEKYPDAFCYERANRLNVTASGIRSAMKRLKISYKKHTKPSQSLQKKRKAFVQKIAKYKKLGVPIVYIDESGFAHDMPRTYGYAKIGERCFGTHDWGAKGRTNVIGALIGKSLLTLALFDCTINTDAFTAWTEQDLLPKLSAEIVIVMDNAAGHILKYLPPYSPDLNPIEYKWAQAKSKRRKYRCGIDELFQEYYL